MGKDWRSFVWSAMLIRLLRGRRLSEEVVLVFDGRSYEKGKEVEGEKN
jgi:hypothetical protein